jgi:hypothetical protein
MTVKALINSLHTNLGGRIDRESAKACQQSFQVDLATLLIPTFLKLRRSTNSSIPRTSRMASSVSTCRDLTRENQKKHVSVRSTLTLFEGVCKWVPQLQQKKHVATGNHQHWIKNPIAAFSIRGTSPAESGRERLI